MTVLFTAEATSVGGREGRFHSTHGALQLDLAIPEESVARADAGSASVSMTRAVSAVGGAAREVVGARCRCGTRGRRGRGPGVPVLERVRGNVWRSRS
jgi:hypothetical protein